MNVERLEEIARWLEAGAPHKKGVDGFSMASFLEKGKIVQLFSYTTTTCGTVCCIAGAANQFFHRRKNTFTQKEEEAAENNDNEIGGYTDAIRAAKVLDIDAHTAFELFGLERQDSFYNNATAEKSAKVIRDFIKTGKVNWKKFGVM